MFDQVVADYEQLDQVGVRFGQQRETVQDVMQAVQTQLNGLQGEWIGRGSDAFFSEMMDEVVPATGRLIQAIEEAQRTTKAIINLMEQADEEASSPLRSFVYHA